MRRTAQISPVIYVRSLVRPLAVSACVLSRTMGRVPSTVAPLHAAVFPAQPITEKCGSRLVQLIPALPHFHVSTLSCLSLLPAYLHCAQVAPNIWSVLVALLGILDDCHVRVIAAQGTPP